MWKEKHLNYDSIIFTTATSLTFPPDYIYTFLIVRDRHKPHFDSEDVETKSILVVLSSILRIRYAIPLLLIQVVECEFRDIWLLFLAGRVHKVSCVGFYRCFSVVICTVICFKCTGTVWQKQDQHIMQKLSVRDRLWIIMYYVCVWRLWNLWNNSLWEHFSWKQTFPAVLYDLWIEERV